MATRLIKSLKLLANVQPRIVTASFSAARNRLGMGSVTRPQVRFNSSGANVGLASQHPGEPELDKLYRAVVVEVRSHDPEVLRSYEIFALMAARELDIKVGRVWEPEKFLYRKTLLKSVFIYKKHRVQYEWRTHYKIMEFKHLTSSTADTFLEYIQRNLPEGCDMKVNRHSLEKLPEFMTKAALESAPPS